MTFGGKLTLGKDVLFRDLGGEAVVLNLRTGKYYGLDEVGARMWGLLVQHGDVARVQEELLREYDVTSERLKEDLLHFVGELVSYGLVQVDPA